MRTDGRTDGRTYGISPHSTGLRPLSGLLPKKVQLFGGLFWAVLRALKEALGAPISDGGCLEEDEND